MNMQNSKLMSRVQRAYENRQRLVAPLVGMPGLKMINSTIKLGQQNYRVHQSALAALIHRFGPDMIFPLMDLSVEANAIGRYTLFPIDDTATVPHVAFHLDHVDMLPKIDIAADTRALGYAKVVELLQNSTDDTIFKGAYVTGPYTLAALILGAQEAAQSIILEPKGLHALTEYCMKIINDYARLLMDHGAEIICVLEPSASMLGPDHFQEFSGNYVKELADLCRRKGVVSVYHVCGNTMHLIGNMVKSGVNGLSLDSPDSGMDLPKIMPKVPKDVLVMGNLNPVGKILTGSPVEVAAEVSELLKSVDSYPNFILSTGCDLPKNTPEKNIKAFMQAGRNYRIAGGK